MRAVIVFCLLFLATSCTHSPSTDDADVQGSNIGRRTITGPVRIGLPGIRKCYETLLEKNNSAYGKVIVDWSIVDSGNVETASIKESDFKDENFHKCILSNVKTWTFPSPAKDQVVDVSHPFIFVPSD